MKKIRISLFFIIICTTFSFAQFSKTHYLPPLAGNSNPNGQPEEQYIYISTPSITPINYKIIRLGSTPILGVVSRDLPVEYNANSEPQFFVPESNVGTILSNRGYIVEADDVVYVTLRTIAGNANQAGELVSKGLAALGTHFRVGAMLNTGATNYSELHFTFVSVLATENNTTINFSDIKPGVSLVNNAGAGNTPASVTLNAGQSYVLAVEGPLDANRDGLIGSLVTSDKPIAVNCGSYVGNNGNLGNVDLGFDQIVSVERVEPIAGAGSDYVFIKSTGQDPVERPLLVIDQNNTQIFLNGSATPSFTKNAGEYVALDGTDYSAAGNLFVHTSKPTFAFQSVGDNVLTSQANQELFFVPPLSCQTPHDISNIPFIERIGTRTFTGRVTIVTQSGSSLNFILNGIPYTYANLPSFITKVGPTAVTGNSGYETYVMTGFTGNVSASSSGELYLAAYGSDGAATFGGFYSGFTFKPEITLGSLLPTQTSCIPNVELKVSTLTAYNAFQWYFNGNSIVGATGFNYFPTAPGYYKVSATITACGTTLVSDDIPVSECPTNIDGDLSNDNVDLDNDNDGIKNCAESYGDLGPDLLNPLAGTVSTGTYSNSFIGTITTGGAGIPVAVPFVGNATGSFVTEIPSGIGSFVKYQMNFTNPVSLSMQYVPATANVTDLIDATEEFVVNSPINKTITVLNPTNQLLIDTNFDGIYESNVTQFSGFEIRFRINGNVPISAGSGTFSFRTYQSTSISITHKNLSNTLGNKATFSFSATCVPKDSDLDGIPDQLDIDSDNDGIPDNTEFMSQVYIPHSNLDANANGVDDAYDVAIIPSDFDGDNVPDYLDLDSDNDGIYDVFESGSAALDTDLNGMVDGLPASFGTNGLSDSLETVVDNGMINYTVANSDATGLNNYVDLDSDNDSCFDVTDAGFTDANNDHLLGNTTPTINPVNGLVTNATDGYTIPNPNYTIVAPIAITTQPINQTQCELQNITFTLVPDATTPIDGYQWQVSIDGGITWTNLTNTALHSGTNTISLLITSVLPTMTGYKYRVYLSRNGNSCGLNSNDAVLTTYALPVVLPTTIIQCDDDTDGISNVNLTVKNNVISANYLLETFTYFKTFKGANTNDTTVQITTPIAYNTANTSVWTRVVNANGCFSIAKIDVIVSATNINAATTQRILNTCDDKIVDSNGTITSSDTDGIASFDLTNDFNSVSTALLATLPPPTSLYTTQFYKSQADALAEIDATGNSLAITNTANYRNIGYPNTQKIWVRVDSNVNNTCNGIDSFITLNIKALPKIDLIGKENVCTNLPLQFVTLNARINDGTSPTLYTYVWKKDGVILSDITYSIDVNSSGIYTVEISSSFGCSRTRTITVYASDIAHLLNPIIIDLTDTNTITVNITGAGDYEYSLDEPSGPFQHSNFFNDVSVGIHTVYINDINGCGSVSQSIGVIGVPKYFTPNGDGFNDFWNIKGIDSTTNGNAIIYIFDRFGKLIKQVSATSQGWDGTFNGQLLPADDYWFTLNLQEGRTAKGHFSLKR